MIKNLLIGVIMFVTFVAGSLIIINSDKDNGTITSQNLGDQNSSAANNSQTATESAELDNEKSIDATEVALHASVTNCWTIVHGIVYELTEYIDSHPGETEIVRACGKDATSLFNNRATEDGYEVGSGTLQSTIAQETLRGLKIGNLKGFTGGTGHSE